MLEETLRAGSDSNSNASIGTRFGLMFDPLHYLSGAFGFQDNYDAFVNKSGDFLNKQGSSVAKPVDSFNRKYNPLHKAVTSTQTGDSAARWISNKPASAAGLVYGGIAGGSALLGGAGQAGSAGSAGSSGAAGWGGAGTGTGNLGVFANGGTGGMAGVGGGNAGTLASSGSIAGGAGQFGGQLGQFSNQYGTQLHKLMSQEGGGAMGGGLLGSAGGMPMSTPAGSEEADQRTALDQTQQRLKGFGRTPIKFKGQVIWV